MTRNTVNQNGPGRVQINKFKVAHKAGDLVFEDGWYGVVEDDVAAGALGFIACQGTFLLPRASGVLAAGTKVYALPTVDATTLAWQGTTAGTHYAIGRLIATSNASLGKVALFSPNSAY